MEKKASLVTGRLHSLDALRGFDMFWIMGGEGIFFALATLTGWPFFQWWSNQLHHAPWHGFRLYDMIFPLFLLLQAYLFPFRWQSVIMVKKIGNRFTDIYLKEDLS